MATINVVNGAKYLFDVKFTVPAGANFANITISDVLAPGFDASTVSTADIIISDGVNPAVNPDSVTFTESDPTGAPGVLDKLTFVVTDATIVNPAAEAEITATFPVFVTDAEALIGGSPITNTAVVTAGGADYDVAGTFDVVAATLSVFTRKATINNNTTDIAPVVISFPALDTQPTTNADYILTVNLAPELADPAADAALSAATVEGYIQVEGAADPVLVNGTDFTAVYTLRDATTDPANPVGGIMEITMAQQERFKDHTLYFYFPTTLVEVQNPIPDPAFLGSGVSLTILGLSDSNIQLTEILDVVVPPVITPGDKIIR